MQDLLAPRVVPVVQDGRQQIYIGTGGHIVVEESPPTKSQRSATPRSANIFAITTLVVACAFETVQAAPGQQAVDPDPVAIVERFNLARSVGDFDSAALSCAAVLELQDLDEDWIVDTAATADWLHELSNVYLVETPSPPIANGNLVSWTERLTARTLPLERPIQARFTIDVHAVIRDGKIAYLSGPYPPIRFRMHSAAEVEPRVQRSSSDVAKGSSASVPPAALFLGTAVVLSLSALLATRSGPALLRRSAALLDRAAEANGPRIAGRSSSPASIEAAPAAQQRFVLSDFGQRGQHVE